MAVSSLDHSGSSWRDLSLRLASAAPRTSWLPSWNGIASVERTRGDILGVLRLNAGKLDLELLHSSAAELGVLDLLERALVE